MSDIPGDEGPLACAVAADPVHKVVRLHFAKPAQWVAMTTDEAAQFAFSLLAKAHELRAKDTLDPEAYTRAQMQEIGNAVEARLPEGFCFLIMAAAPGEEAKLNYLANMDRRSAIKLCKEWLIRCGAEEDWMKHLS